MAPGRGSGAPAWPGRWPAWRAPALAGTAPAAAGCRRARAPAVRRARAAVLAGCPRPHPQTQSATSARRPAQTRGCQRPARARSGGRASAGGTEGLRHAYARGRQAASKGTPVLPLQSRKRIPCNGLGMRSMPEHAAGRSTRARLGRPRELHERRLERGQRALHQAALLPEVAQQRVPQRLPAQRLRAHTHTLTLPEVAQQRVPQQAACPAPARARPRARAVAGSPPPSRRYALVAGGSGQRHRPPNACSAARARRTRAGQGRRAAARSHQRRHSSAGRALGLPRMMRPNLARVSATFRRRGSLRKPMPYARAPGWSLQARRPRPERHGAPARRHALFATSWETRMHQGWRRGARRSKRPSSHTH